MMTCREAGGRESAYSQSFVGENAAVENVARVGSVKDHVAWKRKNGKLQKSARQKKRRASEKIMLAGHLKSIGAKEHCKKKLQERQQRKQTAQSRPRN